MDEWPGEGLAIGVRFWVGDCDGAGLSGPHPPGPPLTRGGEEGVSIGGGEVPCFLRGVRLGQGADGPRSPELARSPPSDPSGTLIATIRRATTIAFQKSFTVAFLMAVVFVVAADFAVFRYLDEFEHPRDAAIVTLPMITLLILTIPRVRRGPFWIGLQAAGWISTLLFGYLEWADVRWFHWPLILTQQVLPRFEDEVNKLGDLPASAIFFTYITVLYTTPLILLSLLGGWIAARWSRRRAGTAADGSAS